MRLLVKAKDYNTRICLSLCLLLDLIYFLIR